MRFVWIGIIEENVFFAPVLETPDLRVIVQKIFSHKGDLDLVPEFQSDEYAIKQLKQLLRQIGGPISLILDDDVLSGLESLLEKFELRMPNCNILLISGSKAPRYSFTYDLKSLNVERAMTLRCHSATPQDGSSLSPDEKIVSKVPCQSLVYSRKCKIVYVIHNFTFREKFKNHTFSLRNYCNDM